MTNLDIYKELLSEIIKSKVVTFGDLAVKKVRHIGALKLDSAGNVTDITGDPIAVLREVLLKFEELSGKTSTIFSKSIIKAIKDKHPDLDLPKEFYD